MECIELLRNERLKKEYEAEMVKNSFNKILFY